MSLRTKRFQLTAEGGTAQIFGQRRSLTDCEDTGLWPGVTDDRCDVSSGKHGGMGDGLQTFVDLDESPGVGCQTRVGEPRGCRCLSDPQSRISGEAFAIFEDEPIGSDL